MDFLDQLYNALETVSPLLVDTDELHVVDYWDRPDDCFRIHLMADESIAVTNDGETEVYASVWEWMRDGWGWQSGVDENTARYFEACAALLRRQMALFPHLNNDHV